LGIEDVLAGHPRLILAAVCGVGLLGLALTSTSGETQLASERLDLEMREVHTRTDQLVGSRPESLIARTWTPSAAPIVESGAGREALAGPPPRTKLLVYSCPTAHRAFVAALERAFEAQETGIDLVLYARSDRDSVGHLLMGNADLAIISTVLSESERSRGLTERVIAHQIVVPIVHASNRIQSIPVVDFQRLIQGQLSNWQRLGGIDLDVQPVCKHRPRINDAADQALRVKSKAEDRTVFLATPREILAYVSNHPRSFGLVSLTHFQGARTVRGLEINHVSATRKNFERGAWPVGATIRSVSPHDPSVDARAFLDYLKSESARNVIGLELTLPD
jgi:hypothetical protein